MAGLTAFILANISMHYIHPPKAWVDTMDAVSGFLYGIAIALMLMFAWINGGRRRGAGSA